MTNGAFPTTRPSGDEVRHWLNSVVDGFNARFPDGTHRTDPADSERFLHRPVWRQARKYECEDLEEVLQLYLKLSPSPQVAPLPTWPLALTRSLERSWAKFTWHPDWTKDDLLDCTWGKRTVLLGLEERGWFNLVEEEAAMDEATVAAVKSVAQVGVGYYDYSLPGPQDAELWLYDPHAGAWVQRKELGEGTVSYWPPKMCLTGRRSWTEEMRFTAFRDCLLDKLVQPPRPS